MRLILVLIQSLMVTMLWWLLLALVVGVQLMNIQVSEGPTSPVVSSGVQISCLE
jgi:hypothetical protein